ncbi:uncharacterized protein LOC115731700 [Rhodamnia argentea]|uniref:Uncharacterized protein LOC115731700 n=1 Tax=Rhodamnia argentea TaxID=178133 RepID=A0A8B8N744_9MYRT|nr:uncharacterized protein LOC115731700 [Rhodamnia argentea]
MEDSGKSISNETRSSLKDQSNSSIGDFPNMKEYRLDGKKFLQWAQIVRTFLKGKGKLSHLEGIGPGQSDPKFQTWDEEDSSIMSWLWSSMQPEISKNYMFLPTAKEIWEAVRQSYSKVQDVAVIYELKTKASTTKQGNRSVTEYYNLKRGLWLEIDHNLNIQMRCVEDTNTLRNHMERDRIFEFLAGLNANYDQIRVQILRKKRLSSLNEVFSTVRGEESRQTVMLEYQHTEGSAMKAIKKETNPDTNRRPDLIKTTGSEGFWCSFCRKPCHTRENCFKLHGRTQVLSRTQRQPQAHMTSEGEAAPIDQYKPVCEEIFNREEVGKIRALLDSLSKSSDMCSLVQLGPKNGEDDWIC